MIYGDKAKQQARVSILQRLKQKGMPSMSPVPGPISEEEMVGEEETLNDLGPSQALQMRLNPKKKKVMPEEGAL
jgi:hypothetical protein